MLINKYLINTMIGLSMLFGFSTGSAALADNMYQDSLTDSSCYSAYTYFKLGGSVLTAKEWKDLMPAIGVGRRYEWTGKAVDISANYAANGHSGHYFSIPKIMYLQYLTPQSNCSPYLGGGLSWGEVRDKHEDHKFQGIFAEFAVGYEFQRQSPIRTFVQLDLSQGLLAHNKRGSTPAPTLALTAGIGF